MDRLDELAIFVRIVEEGSLARAAARLRRSPPAVTRALASLEDRIGLRQPVHRRAELRRTGQAARVPGYMLARETHAGVLAEMIEELGHQIVAEAGSIESALPLAETAAFDIAILDVNIGGYYIDKVAQTIVRRGLPFIFVTGYAKAALPPAVIDRPHLQKPCLPEMLRREITSALGPEAARPLTAAASLKSSLTA